MHCLLICLALLVPSWSLAQTIPVPDREGLLQALALASGGEVLLLSAGNYGELDLFPKGPVTPIFDKEVVLRGADPESPPVFERLKLTGARNLAFEDVLFDYRFKEGEVPGEVRPFQVRASTDIRFSRVVFDGDTARGVGPTDDHFGVGIGLSARGVTRLIVERSVIRGFYRGLSVGEGTDVRILRNDLYDLRSDGMNFVKATGLLVEANVIRDFKRSFDSQDHADMIQFWSMNADYPSTDVLIRRNLLTAGNGDHTQAIFMRNEAVDTQGGGSPMFYRDIVIEENLILNSHFHGITVGETQGLVIRRNTLIRVPRRSELGTRGDFANMPGIQVAEGSQDVVIQNNIASRVPKVRTGWVQAGNALVQDLEPLKKGYYPRVFTKPFGSAPYPPKNFSAIVGGEVDRMNLGAPIAAFRWGE